MADNTSTSVSFDESATYTGRVKWFNNSRDMDLAVVIGNDKQGEDIFVHHSGIKVDTEQYKYLVQGEYVDFTLRSSENNDHPYQATNVTGVNEKSSCVRPEMRFVLSVPKLVRLVRTMVLRLGDPDSRGVRDTGLRELRQLASGI